MVTEDPNQPEVMSEAPAAQAANPATGRRRRVMRSRSLRTPEELLAAAPEEQIAEAVAAERWARAVDLLSQHGERILLDGGLTSLASWLDAIPKAQWRPNVSLDLLLGWVRLYEERYQAGHAALAQAERAFQRVRLGEAPELEGRAQAELAQGVEALRAHLRALTDPGAAPPAQVEDIMPAASAEHPLWRAAALVVLGRCRLLAGDLSNAVGDLETALVLADAAAGSRSRTIAARAHLHLGRLAEARLDLDQAMIHYATVSSSDQASLRDRALFGKVRLALMRLDRAGAEAALKSVSPSDEAVAGLRTQVEGALVRAQLAMAEGELDEARGLLDGLERVLSSEGILWGADALTALRADLALLRGEAPQLRRWIQQFSLRSRRTQPATPAEATLKVREAVVAAVLLQPEAARMAAAEVRAFAERTGHRALLAEAEVALTWAYYGLGDVAAARAAFEAARGLAAGAPAIFALPGLDHVLSELGVARPVLPNEPGPVVEVSEIATDSEAEGSSR